MNAKLKTTIWAITLFFSIASLMVISSCNDDGDDVPPPPEVVAPSDFTYPASTVAVGAEGSVSPSTVEGTDPTFEISSVTDADDASVPADFFSVDASGNISVAMESTTGFYKVTVTASNTAGTGSGTAEITIGVNESFDPTGKGYTWQYFINQDDPWLLEGLRGELAELPFDSIMVPTGWPPDWPQGNAEWNEQYLFPYLILGQLMDLIFQVPSDIACEALDPAQNGDQLYFEVGEDLGLTTLCTITEDKDGDRVPIGSSSISYAEGKFHWAVTLQSQIPVTYIISDPVFNEQFIDPLEPGENQVPPRIYTAVNGVVDQFTTPTNVANEGSILTSLTVKKVEVVLEVHAL